MPSSTLQRSAFFVTLSGSAEITVHDGTTRGVGPGDISLTEDLTGEGHRTQMGPEGRVCLVITLE